MKYARINDAVILPRNVFRTMGFDLRAIRGEVGLVCSVNEKHKANGEPSKPEVYVNFANQDNNRYSEFLFPWEYVLLNDDSTPYLRDDEIGELDDKAAAPASVTRVFTLKKSLQEEFGDIFSIRVLYPTGYAIGDITVETFYKGNEPGRRINGVELTMTELRIFGEIADACAKSHDVDREKLGVAFTVDFLANTFELVGSVQRVPEPFIVHEIGASSESV